MNNKAIIKFQFQNAAWLIVSALRYCSVRTGICNILTNHSPTKELSPLFSRSNYCIWSPTCFLNMISFRSKYIIIIYYCVLLSLFFIFFPLNFHFENATSLNLFISITLRILYVVLHILKLIKFTRSRYMPTRKRQKLLLISWDVFRV